MSIAYDSSANGIATANSTGTFSHTCSGTNRYLFVTSNADISAVTHDGVSMTQLTTYTPQSYGGNTAPSISVWGLANPATGSKTISVYNGNSNTDVIESVSYTGVDPIQAEAYNTLETGVNAQTGITSNVTTVTADAWVAAFVSSTGSTSFTPGASTTERQDTGSTWRRCIVDSNAAEATPGNYNLITNLSSGTGRLSSVMYSVKPYLTYTFSGPASGNVNSVSTNFTVTPDVAITGTITITPSGVGSAGLSATILTFSNSATPQTFTITPLTAGAITLTAATGTTLNNPASLTYTAAAVVPDAPVIGTAIPGNTNASITFSAPASNGGASITTYTATSTPGSITGTSATSPVVVTGLTNGVAYTFKVKATNSAGVGAESSASNSATPYVAATSFTFTGPTSGSVRSASTNFTLTPNAVYYGTITVTPTGVGSTGLSATTLTWSGSSAAQTFTITPTASGAITLTPTNSNGLSNPANITYTAAAVVPLAPGIGIASRGNTYSDVTVSAPSNDGGASVTIYTVTSSPGSLTGVSTTPGVIRVSGLTNGTTYTFSATATNSVGTSASSSASNAVTPSADSTNFTNSGPKFNITKTSGNLIQF